MMTITFSLILLLLQSLLILSAKINIYPEFFFIPWLMGKGLLIYRDIAAQHGFLLYSLLIPLAQDRSLLLMKLFYVILQAVNLLLILFILKKTGSKLGFILGGLFYLIANFYVSDNNLWNDMVITTLYLLIYYFLILSRVNKKKSTGLILGMLIALSSLIKINASIILLPVLIILGNLLPLISFSIIWGSVFVFFWITHGLSQMVENIFSYNFFYAVVNTAYTFKTCEIYLNWTFVNLTLIFLIFSVILFFQNKKTLKDFTIVLFLAVSLLFLFPGPTKAHLNIFFAFFSLLLAKNLTALRKKTLLLYLIIFFLYGIYLARITKHEYVYSYLTRTPIMENKSVAKIVTILKQYPLTDKRFYVVANEPAIYYYLDKTPPVYMPIIFPITLKYKPAIEYQLIDELQKNKVNIIAIPQPIDVNYQNLHHLTDYINKNYTLVQQNNYLKIYKNE